VVMAAGGYPASPKKGDAITGLPAGTDDMQVFHAGTARRDDGTLVTNGGRVLTVTALGDPLRAARERAYAALESIRFDGMQFRRDIGHRALRGR
jgi:phosphoribosylamine---glycine ligase